MGFNSVAVIFNDYTHRLADDDGRISRSIAEAMRGWSMRDRNKFATWQAHADYSQVVVVGRNTGKPLAECNDLDWYAIDQLKAALERHGYKVTKPRKPKRPGDRTEVSDVRP